MGALRAWAIGKHIAKKIPKAVARKIRPVPPIEVLAEEWLERSGKGKKVLYLALKYDYGQKHRGLAYEEYNFFSSIKELDVELFRVDIYTLYDLYGKKVVNAVIKEIILREKIETVFFFHYLDIIDHEMFKDFSENYKNVETILWLCDDDVRYEETKELVKCFNKVVTTIEQRHKQRLKLGINSHFSQFLSNTSLYENLHLTKRYDVTFIGQKFGNRPEYIEHLKKNGIAVQVYGPFWRRDSRISQMEMIEIINRTKIMLNFSSSSKDYSKKFIKGRVFEIISCGTFLLTEECEDLDNYLTAGKDVVVFKNKEEAVKKIKYYLKKEKERENIALHGEQTVRKKYSFQNEFKKILGV